MRRSDARSPCHAQDETCFARDGEFAPCVVGLVLGSAASPERAGLA